MRISAVRVTPVALRDPPLLNAAGIHEPYCLRSIIEVEGDGGQVGLGETYGDAPLLHALNIIAERLPGIEIHNLNGLHKRVAQCLETTKVAGAGAELAPGSQPGKLFANCVSAFEVALLDLQAREVGVPLHALLGGAVRRSVPFSAYLFFKYARHIDPEEAADGWGEALSPEQIVEQARRMTQAHGFGSIKLKAGVMAPELEVSCIEALASAFPGLPLRIDPNGAWKIETARACARRLGPLIEYYEDPVDGLAAMRDLHRAIGLPLATNMVVTNFEELAAAIRSNAVQIILSDHHYWGGLRASQQLAAICRTFGLGLSMHSNSHLGISLMAMAHLAAATPNLTYACDTHYPWVEDDDEIVEGGKIAITQGCVTVSDAPGLGLSLDRNRLARAHAMFQRITIRTRDDLAQMRKYQPSFSAHKPRF